MKFGKNHKVKVSTLNRDEASDFLCFLTDEKIRHRKELDFSGQILDADEPPAYRAFYQSAILRHQEDIKEIDKLIEKVREKFKQ